MYKVVGEQLKHQFEAALNEAEADGYKLINFIHTSHYIGVLWKDDDA